MSIFEFPVQLFQSGGNIASPISTTFGIQPYVAPIQGINPGVQRFNVNTQPLDVSNFFRAEQIKDQRGRDDLNERKFDFAVQKEMAKLNNELFDDLYSANKSLKGVNTDGFGLNQNYKRNQVASQKAHNFTANAQDKLSRLISSSDGRNFALLSSEANKVRIDTQRRIELESGVGEEALLDSEMQNFMETMRSRKGKDQNINAIGVAKLWEEYETYKNNTDPGATFDRSKINVDRYSFNNKEVTARFDELADLSLGNLENVEAIAKNTGLPKGFILQVKSNKQQNDTERATEILTRAYEADPKIMTFLESTGRGAFEAANDAVLLRKRDETRQVEKIVDGRTDGQKGKNTGTKKTATERGREDKVNKRQELLTSISNGDSAKINSLVGKKTDYEGTSVKISSAVFEERTPEGVLDDSIKQKGVKITLSNEEERFIPINQFDGTGLLEINEILNSTLNAGNKVDDDDLNDYIDSFGNRNSTTQTTNTSTSTGKKAIGGSFKTN